MALLSQAVFLACARRKPRCTPSSVGNPAVFTTVLNIGKRMNERSSLSFDSDSSTVVCDNSTNVHVCNNIQSFVGELQPITGHQVATIGGRGHAPSGIGTAQWTWKDDEGNSHQFLVDNTLCFPQSPTYKYFERHGVCQAIGRPGRHRN